MEVILERRNATGYSAKGYGEPRPVDFAETGPARWQRTVHDPGIYDLEVDTSVLSPEECAQAIRDCLDKGPAPTAIQRLAAMARDQE